MKNYIFIVLVFFVFNLSAQTSAVLRTQLPVIEAPQGPNPYQYQYQPSYQHQQQTDPYNPNEVTNINRRNENVINEALAYQRRMDAETQRQSDIKMLISQGFPSESGQKGTSYFYQAFDEINSMLQGKQPLNLGRSVFLIENAYLGNSLNYTDYQNTIKSKVELCKQKIREDKLDPNSNIVKNMMLFRLVSDTLKIKVKGAEKPLTHLPIKYDLEGYDYTTHYGTQFVTYLMKNGIGQCHSMPLYYLVLAEEMGAKAYLAYSPLHSFVKIQDEKGTWYNLELTCGAILSDAHYMNSSYIKAEAIRNRIYLEPMDKTNIVAQMMLEMASGYYEKYGYDDFYLKCVNTAQQYLSNKLNATISKVAYEEQLTMVLAYLLDAKKPEIMKEKSPGAYKHYEQVQALYKQIDDLGYEELPKSVYDTWLKHIAKLKAKEDKRKPF